MKLLLDSDRFKDYTEIHKKDIGVDITAAFSGIITGLTVLVPAVSDLLLMNPYSISDWILAAIGLTAVSYGAFRFVHFLKCRYSSKVLYKDVKNMDETLHRFSLVAIKDTFHEYPNRFLLRYDDDWQCDLFFSFRTKDDMAEDEENIRNRLSHLLKVPSNDISVDYINETPQTKFSQKDKVMKIYEHRLFSAAIKNWPSEETRETFTTDGIHYRWETIEEMKRDPEIQKKNLDVVEFVEANIP